MSLNSTVISFVPFEIREEKPGLCPSRYFIPASDMKTPQLLPVGTGNHFVYLDEARGSLRVPDPSDQIARSIVEDYVTSQLGVDENARPALFWLPEDITVERVLTEHKIEVARIKLLQMQWFKNVARLADNDWSRYHQHNVVSEFQRKCAKFIGWKPEDHEWMEPTLNESVSCHVCGSQIGKTAIVCPICKAVLDETAAKEKGVKFTTV